MQRLQRATYPQFIATQVTTHEERSGQKPQANDRRSEEWSIPLVMPAQPARMNVYCNKLVNKTLYVFVSIRIS